jgi:hypothetical protein
MKTVQSDDIFKLCIAYQFNRPNYESTSVEEHGCDVQAAALLLDDCPVLFNRGFGSKVDHKCLLLNFVRDFRELFINFGFVSTAYYNVEALSRKLMTHFKTNTIAATSDQSPGATLRVSILSVKRSRKDWS